MKFVADIASVFPVLINLDQQAATARSLLTELPAESDDRRYISEWLAETLASIYRIERQLTASALHGERDDNRQQRNDSCACVDHQSTVEQREGIC